MDEPPPPSLSEDDDGVNRELELPPQQDNDVDQVSDRINGVDGDSIDQRENVHREEEEQMHGDDQHEQDDTVQAYDDNLNSHDLHREDEEEHIPSGDEEQDHNDVENEDNTVMNRPRKSASAAANKNGPDYVNLRGCLGRVHHKELKQEELDALAKVKLWPAELSKGKYYHDFSEEQIQALNKVRESVWERENKKQFPPLSPNTRRETEQSMRLQREQLAAAADSTAQMHDQNISTQANQFGYPPQMQNYPPQYYHHHPPPPPHPLEEYHQQNQDEKEENDDEHVDEGDHSNSSEQEHHHHHDQQQQQQQQRENQKRQLQDSSSNEPNKKHYYYNQDDQAQQQQQQQPQDNDDQQQQETNGHNNSNNFW